jgi:hypothetical protein
MPEQTYVEKELLPLGFRTERVKIVDFLPRSVIMTIGHLKLLFECCCASYPSGRSLGCPIHHDGPGSSWPVDEAKKLPAIIAH